MKKVFVFGGIFALGILFGASFFGGSGKAGMPQRVTGILMPTESDEVSFQEFWDVWKLVKEKHVSTTISDVNLFYGAMEGMVRGVGDPYTTFFPPKEAEAFASDLSGSFSGIGAEIGKKNNQLVVIAPMPESPAEKAGIRAEDVILAVDGVDVSGLTVEECVQKIRGEKGTSVTLTLLKKGEETFHDVKLVRDTIIVPSVRYEKKDGDIAYIRLSYFHQETSSEFDAIVRKVLADRPKGIVLDVRSNPGGYLDMAVDIASEWITDGPIVRERSRIGEEQVRTANGQHRFAGIPTVVLVDGGSASASEIVAGALQDTDMATLVGTTTFGKGSVQELLPLKDGSSLKLTVAAWYTPAGRQIDHTGITPDIVVDPQWSTSTPPTDFALLRALEELQKQSR